jgi:methyltransferase family protein
LITGSWRARARNAARVVTPFGIEWLLMLRRNRRSLRQIEADKVRDVPTADTRVEEAIRFLVDRGLNERQVREGSVPEDSLRHIAAVVSNHLPSSRPVRALHVGNFVGVSLCYLSWLFRERHPESLVVSIDPNITHRGIEDPQAHVLALLHHFDLLRNNLIIPGYTLEQTAGETLTDTLEADYLAELACENVLATLDRLCGQRFDLALLDGNHEESYLAREFAAVRRLITDNGIVVFDDVTEGWGGVREVFSQALQDPNFVELGHGQRVGILRAVTGAARSTATATDQRKG